MTGMLFASGRRTVKTWLRVAGVSDDYQDHYDFLTSIGRKSDSIATQLMLLVLRTLDLPAVLRPVIEAFSDRATIEQDFHDVKEVWGSGQQQFRNI